jgi:hypothetical protein
MNQTMNQSFDQYLPFDEHLPHNKNMMIEMIETQREYINILLKEKYYFTQENKFLQERVRQNELIIDTMQVKYISYLDDYAKNSIVLTDKIKLMETENTQIKKDLEKEKEKNIPIGVRINDLDDDWEWKDNGKLHIDDLNITSEEFENKEKYLIEYLYTIQPSHNSKKNENYVSCETQTDEVVEYEYSESTINENNKTIFPDLSSILEDSCNDLDEYIDKYDSYLFERF